MLFSTNTQIDRPNILIGASQIKYVESARNLGIIFNENLSWDTHINNICSKVYFALSRLKNANAIFNIELRRKLVLALIIPIMTYGDVIFSNALAAELLKLERCFNACIRFIYRRKRFDHLSDVRNSLLGCGLETYFKFRLITQLFSIVHHQQPKYLYDAITFARSARTRNIILPRARTEIQRDSLAFRSARSWNELPTELKSATSISRFKKTLKLISTSRQIELTHKSHVQLCSPPLIIPRSFTFCSPCT